jgi:hypothetical protein
MRLTELGGAAIAMAMAGACSAGDLTLPESDRTPATLRVLSGADQRAEAGSLLPEPIAVQLLDDRAEPVGQARIVFGFAGEVEGAVIEPASALTDDAGRAAAFVRLGDTPGEQLIVAQLADANAADLRARITVTATEPDDDGNGGEGKKGGRGKDGEDDD